MSEGQKTHRFSRWVTDFDGGRPVRAYQQFADDLDGPWLGGRFNTDMCLCGHERRQHAEEGFQTCRVCPDGDCVAFHYAIVGLRPHAEEPRPLQEPSTTSAEHALYTGGPCQDCGQPVIKLEGGWHHVFEADSAKCATPGLSVDGPTHDHPAHILLPGCPACEASVHDVSAERDRSGTPGTDYHYGYSVGYENGWNAHVQLSRGSASVDRIALVRDIQEILEEFLPGQEETVSLATEWIVRRVTAPTEGDVQ